MKTIFEAKRALGRELRSLDGFVGIGIEDGDQIRVYAKSEKVKAVKHLRSQFGESYEGFQVNVILSSGFRAHDAKE